MIGVHDPWITDEERATVGEALASGWISGHGDFIPKFESEFARALGLPHPVLSTVNGSAALILALRSLPLSPGYRALLCDYGFVATANAVVHTGGVPVLLGPDDAGPPVVGPARIAATLERTPDIRVVVYNQPYGFAGDMRSIRALCDRHGIWLVEDSAQAMAIRQDGRPLGSFGHAGCWSLNGNKTVSCGMGGAVFFAEEGLAERAGRLRIHGRSDPFDFHYEELGYNFQLSNVLAALGCAQLRRLGTILERKQACRSRYAELLADRGRRLLGAAASPAWLNLLWLDRPRDRPFFRQLAELAGRHGIQLRPAFPPLSSYPMYAAAERHGDEHSFAVFRQSFCLPSGPALSDAELERVVAVVDRSLRSLDA